MPRGHVSLPGPCVSTGDLPAVHEGSISRQQTSIFVLLVAIEIAARPWVPSEALYREGTASAVDISVSCKSKSVAYPCPRRICGRGSVYSPGGKAEGLPSRENRRTWKSCARLHEAVRRLSAGMGRRWVAEASGRIRSARPDASGGRVHRPPQR